MAHTLDIGVELDRDRTVFGVAMPNGGKKIFEMPSQIGISQTGIVIGTNAEDTGAYRVFETERIRDDISDSDDRTGSEYPLALFLTRSIDQIKLAISRQVDDTVEIGSGYFSIPAGASDDTVQAIQYSATEAGFSNIEVERRPTLATRRASKQRSDAKTILSLVIGAGEADLALYRLDESEITTIARSSHPDLGSREWSKSLSETLFEQIGAEQNACVEYTEKSLEDLAHSIRLTTRNKPEEASELDVPSVSHRIDSGAKLVAGNHTLRDEVHIDKNIDIDIQYEALEDYLKELLNKIQSLSEHAAVSPDEIDLVVGGGDGYSLNAIHQTIEDAVPDTASIINEHSFKESVKLATELAKSEEVSLQATKTLSHRIALRGAGDDGIKREVMTPILLSSAEDQLFTLKTVDQKQVRGRFDIEFLLPGSDVSDKSLSVRLTGIPSSIDDHIKKIPLRLTVDTTQLPTRNDVFVIVDDSELRESIQVTISDEPGTNPPHYLALPNQQNIDPPTYDDTNAEIEYATERTPLVDAVEELKQADIANAIHEVRSDLWNWGVSDGRSLDPSDIKTLLRELDQRLSRYGVEFYVPELGTEAQPRRHKIRKQEPADAEEGAIIEVLKPGMKINGEQAVSAIVSISNGESPENTSTAEEFDSQSSSRESDGKSGKEDESGVDSSSEPSSTKHSDDEQVESQDEGKNSEERSGYNKS